MWTITSINIHLIRKIILPLGKRLVSGTEENKKTERVMNGITNYEPS